MEVGTVDLTGNRVGSVETHNVEWGGEANSWAKA